MAQQESMDILELQRRFATDDACRDRLFKIRWPDGPTCAKCGGKNFYRISARNVYECRCGRQVSLTAGTIMHGSHTPLRKWFWAICMVARDKRGVSALRLQRELSVSYPTAWLMLRKIRHEWARGTACACCPGLRRRTRRASAERRKAGSAGEGRRRRRRRRSCPLGAPQVREDACSRGRRRGLHKGFCGNDPKIRHASKRAFKTYERKNLVALKGESPTRLPLFFRVPSRLLFPPGFCIQFRHRPLRRARFPDQAL